MIIDNAGTYTLKYTATDDCGKQTVVDRELVVQSKVFGIVQRYTSGANMDSFYRTDNSIDLVQSSDAIFPQHSDGNGGWSNGFSPFDNVMPWSGIEEVEDSTLGTLVKIPKYYYKWGIDNDLLSLKISPSQQDGFHVSPAHADRGDGVGERDVVYVGKYHCADDYTSKPNVLPTREMSRSVARTSIHNLGSDVWQWDFAMYWTIAMLYLVEFSNWDSQAKIGAGCSNEGVIENTGLTDAMTYHTGTTARNVNASNFGHTQYRYIEDLWGNVMDWVDGIYFNNADIYCIKNPNDFSDNANGIHVGTRYIGAGTNSYTQQFTDPSEINGFEYALYTKTTNYAYSSLSKDRSDNSSSAKTLAVGGNASHDQMNGLFRFYSTTTTDGFGSRLMKLPSA